MVGGTAKESLQQTSQTYKADNDFPTKDTWIRQMYEKGSLKVPERVDTMLAFLKNTDSILEEEDVNPFTTAKIKLTDELKRDEKEAKAEEMKKKFSLPVISKTTKAASLKVLAGHKVKRFIYLQQLQQTESKSSKLVFDRESKNKLRECPIVIYKHLRKELCLMNYAINKKREEMKNLDKKVEEEEQWIQRQFRQIDIDKDNYDSAMTQKCRQATEAIRKADKITKERIDLCESISKCAFKYAHLNTECLKLEDILQNLIKYKKFTDFVTPHELKMMYLENTNTTKKDLEPTVSFQKNLKMPVIKIDKNMNNETTDDDFDSESKKTDLNADQYGQDLSESSTKLSIVTIETSIDSDDEHIPLYFSDPKEMRDILMELEESNLRVIQNVQDQEELIEETRASIKKFQEDSKEEKVKLKAQIEKSGQQVAQIDEEIQKITDAMEFLDSFKQLQRYESLFFFGPHEYDNIDQMLSYLEHIVKDTYEAVFGALDTIQDCVNMLKRIESQMDFLYLKSKTYPRHLLNKHRDILYEMKRLQARKRQLQHMKEMNEEKLRRTEEKARMPAKVKWGRPLIWRSQPPIKEVTVESIDWEALELEEEMEFFFS